MVCRNLSAFADAPRAGSAEAKSGDVPQLIVGRDAPRAGSAEAKRHAIQRRQPRAGDAPRAGSAEAKIALAAIRAGT